MFVCVAEFKLFNPEKTSFSSQITIVLRLVKDTPPDKGRSIRAHLTLCGRGGGSGLESMKQNTCRGKLHFLFCGENRHRKNAGSCVAASGGEGKNCLTGLPGTTWSDDSSVALCVCEKVMANCSWLHFCMQTDVGGAITECDQGMWR